MASKQSTSSGQQRMDEILRAQHAGMEAVLSSSRELVAAEAAFSIEGLEALLEMRAEHIAAISALEGERSELSVSEPGKGQKQMLSAIDSVVEELGNVDDQLQNLMQKRRIEIINSMASMQNRVNFNNLTDQEHTGNRVLNVVR
jgi:hypothetical protein